MKIIISLLCACGCVLAWDVFLEKMEVDYNSKYFKVFNTSLKKTSRRSPYLLNVYVVTNIEAGNNLLIRWTLYEVISGRLILTPVRVEYRLCDFLNKDVYFGKMMLDQLPDNMTCPFPAGVIHMQNIKTSFENVPFRIPFTYSSLNVRVCMVIEGFVATESVYRYKAFVFLKQKLSEKHPIKKHLKLF